MILKMTLRTSGNNVFNLALAIYGFAFEEAKAHFSAQDKSYLGLRNALSVRILYESSNMALRNTRRGKYAKGTI